MLEVKVNFSDPTGGVVGTVGTGGMSTVGTVFVGGSTDCPAKQGN